MGSLGVTLMQLSQDDLKDIWAKVQENHRILDLCVGPHEFLSITPDPKKLDKKFQCTKCGGVITSSDLFWYNHGVGHGSKQNSN